MSKRKINLNELTPPSMQCVVGACPAIFETDRETYIIIGKQLTSEQIQEYFNEKVNSNETAIEVPKKLIK